MLKRKVVWAQENNHKILPRWLLLARPIINGLFLKELIYWRDKIPAKEWYQLGDVWESSGVKGSFLIRNGTHWIDPPVNVLPQQLVVLLLKHQPEKNIFVNPNVKLKWELKQSESFALYPLLLGDWLRCSLPVWPEFVSACVSSELSPQTTTTTTSTHPSPPTTHRINFVLCFLEYVTSLMCWLRPYGPRKNRKNLRVHFIESVAFKTVNSSENVNVSPRHVM